MKSPMYGGASLGPGIHVKNIQSQFAGSSRHVEVEITLLVDGHQVDMNDLMSKLQDLTKPTLANSMTSSTVLATPSGFHAEVREHPIEHTNGDGEASPEKEEDLKMLIERRFDEVDQALRLLVDP